jgi:transposase-like protein
MRRYGQVGSEETLQFVSSRVKLTTIYSYTEAARSLGVHPQTIRDWIMRGEATPLYVGAISRRLYLGQDEVERLRSEQEGAKGE